jgi:DNA-binding NarL/FixJ family response regulator
MRVLIIEDLPILRLGIKTAILPTNMEVFEADSGLKGLESIRQNHPDVVLFKIDLPDLNGIDLITAIHDEFPDIKIVVLSEHSDEGLLKLAFNSGATSYLLEDTDPEILLYALKLSYEGLCWIDPRVSRSILDIESDTNSKGKRKFRESLTPMEMKVLKLMAFGFSNEKIAEKLHVSTGSIRGYTNSLNLKLGSLNRPHAVFLAIFFGYINCKSLFEEFGGSGNLPAVNIR